MSCCFESSTLLIGYNDGFLSAFESMHYMSIDTKKLFSRRKKRALFPSRTHSFDKPVRVHVCVRMGIFDEK